MVSKLLVSLALLSTVCCSCLAATKGNPCKNCPNARVLFQGICIEECPFGHVKVKAKGYFECELCDISKRTSPQRETEKMCLC